MRGFDKKSDLGMRPTTCRHQRHLSLLPPWPATSDYEVHTYDISLTMYNLKAVIMMVVKNTVSGGWPIWITISGESASLHF